MSLVVATVSSPNNCSQRTRCCYWWCWRWWALLWPTLSLCHDPRKVLLVRHCVPVSSTTTQATTDTSTAEQAYTVTDANDHVGFWLQFICFNPQTHFGKSCCYWWCWRWWALLWPSLTLCHDPRKALLVRHCVPASSTTTRATMDTSMAEQADTVKVAKDHVEFWLQFICFNPQTYFVWFTILVLLLVVLALVGAALANPFPLPQPQEGAAREALRPSEQYYYPGYYGYLYG
ncbi:uncharacterized protein LOC124789157 [Schistocerca piceifrons]|uniref:uncharacterized protein LOC124789157 n=1 Tax=Schistocerca piceifrons TaxID=274613 RepID=UPI001F5E660B|nr:uncharacterized protein LOC124789157 [Schistocerca piceifrons]